MSDDIMTPERLVRQGKFITHGPSEDDQCLIVCGSGSGGEWHIARVYGSIDGCTEESSAESICTILNEYKELKRREAGLVLALEKIRQQQAELDLQAKEIAKTRKWAREFVGYINAKESDSTHRWVPEFKSLVDTAKEFEREDA